MLQSTRALPAPGSLTEMVDTATEKDQAGKLKVNWWFWTLSDTVLRSEETSTWYIYPQIIAQERNNIERMFPATTAAQASPTKPRARQEYAAMKVPVRLSKFNVRDKQHKLISLSFFISNIESSENRLIPKISFERNSPSNQVYNWFLLVLVNSSVKIINIIAAMATYKKLLEKNSHLSFKNIGWAWQEWCMWGRGRGVKRKSVIYSIESLHLFPCMGL